MLVRWSPEAYDDFARIVQHIRRENPTAALRAANTIYERVAQLKTFPHRGRPGRVDGTRELVLSTLPFVVVYRVLENAVEVVRVLHGAQRWP
jgi:toxin ParE1/3/4